MANDGILYEIVWDKDIKKFRRKDLENPKSLGRTYAAAEHVLDFASNQIVHQGMRHDRLKLNDEAQSVPIKMWVVKTTPEGYSVYDYETLGEAYYELIGKHLAAVHSLEEQGDNLLEARVN